MTKRCIRCNVDIIDDAIECPLCHGVLEENIQVENELGESSQEESDMDDVTKDGDLAEHESKSLTYPDVSTKLKITRLILRIVLFAAIVAEAVVLLVNYMTFNGVYWSFIVGVSLVYGCLSLYYALRKRRSLQRIIIFQMFMIIIMFIALDYLLGFRGWSYRYAIPVLLAAVDVGVVVLMIVAIEGWQTYIITEILTLLMSIGLMITIYIKQNVFSMFSLLSTLLTGMIFLGTVMFGERMISNEIIRRFKV